MRAHALDRCRLEQIGLRKQLFTTLSSRIALLHANTSTELVLKSATERVQQDLESGMISADDALFDDCLRSDNQDIRAKTFFLS